ncbi:MAG: hypothetical protein K5928_07410 [Prevotella sp.]|nr:hypothetical protein [Prevotella sp.]
MSGGNTTVTLAVSASPGCEWSITWTDTWIRSISPSTGRGTQNATVTAEVNPSSTTSRSATISVQKTDGTITRTVTLTQSANTEQLSVSPNTLSFTSDGGTSSASVISNTHWTVDGGADWIESITPMEGDGNGSLTIRTKANLTENNLEATLTLRSSGGMAVPLKVTQAGMVAKLSVSPTSISATATSATYQIAIETNVAWTAHSNQSWAILSETAGSVSKTIDIHVADNLLLSPRDADITISYSTGKQAVAHITQSAGERPVIGSLNEANITNVTKTEATVSFSFQSMYDVIEYGVCYSSTSTSPTTSGAHLGQSAMDKQGTASLRLTGLDAGTTYYIRAYAVSAVGTQYSNSLSFTTVSGWPGEDDNVTPN